MQSIGHVFRKQMVVVSLRSDGFDGRYELKCKSASLRLQKHRNRKSAMQICDGTQMFL